MESAETGRVLDSRLLPSCLCRCRLPSRTNILYREPYVLVRETIRDREDEPSGSALWRTRDNQLHVDGYLPSARRDRVWGSKYSPFSWMFRRPLARTNIACHV